MEIHMKNLESMARAIDNRAPALTVAQAYYAGTQPLSYLSPEARKQRGDRLSHLGANYCKLATDSVAERLHVTGFTRAGESLGAVWDAWVRAGMVYRSSDAIQEALTTGQSFLVVWADSQGEPVGSVESPREMSIRRDPLTGEVVEAVKRWRDAEGHARLAHYSKDAVRLYKGPEVPEGGVMPNVGWQAVESHPNPLQVCPVADLTNSEGMWDTDGTPESRQIWELVDALNKTLADAMVASEATALQRRWASGIQLQFDEEDNLIPPFSTQPGNVWLTENAEAKFGSFPEPKLEAYGAHSAMLIRQIGAISGLPDHLVGIAGNDPSSAEQIRAAESSLVSRAYARQSRFGQGFSKAAALFEAILSGGRVATDVQTVWKSPESRTRAQEADAASKLVQAGILPLEAAWTDLGYSPEEIIRFRQMNLRNSIETGGERP